MKKLAISKWLGIQQDGAPKDVVEEAKEVEEDAMAALMAAKDDEQAKRLPMLLLPRMHNLPLEPNIATPKSSYVAIPRLTSEQV